MATRPDPSISEVERAFAEEMQREGFLPGPIQSDTDDFVRFDAPGDKAGRRNGFYKLRTGRFPVGWFGDWKLGTQYQWFYRDPNAPPLTDAERKAIKREQAKLKAEEAQARESRQAEVAEKASAMWKRAGSDVEGFAYLDRKGIAIPRGLRIYSANDGTRLLAVPMWAFDMNGQPQLTNLQLIDAGGSKVFLKAGRVEGCFFSIKGDASLIVICEGVATAFSIWQATGLSVVAAFNSGNLIEVAKEFARWRPLATLMIAADNDEFAPDDWAEKSGGRAWVNAGIKKAEAAAKAVGCRWISPLFKEGPARQRTDFNDLHLIEGEQAVRGQVIGAFRSVEPEDAAPGAQIVDIDQVQDESWRSALPRTSSGALDGGNIEGVALYIANHKHLRSRLRFNLLSKAIEIDGNEMEDHHIGEFRRIMHADRFKAKKPDVKDEMLAEARRHQFDPLVDYLQGLKWDGRERLTRWMPTYLGAPATPYTAIIGRKSLIGAAARALNPGCKLDEMVVLEGAQGVGKSTALRYLFGDRFFIDELPDFHSKDSFLQLQGAWCVEVAELSALSKADVKDVKKFLSRLVDKYRPPYGVMPIQVPRRTVFWGTVNPEEGGYLRDPTGARRFWPVETTTIDLPGILRDRDQLWAEAVAAFVGGEKWHLNDENEIAEAVAEQDKRREVDPWEAPVANWLAEHGYTRVTPEVVLSSAVKLDADRQEARHIRRVGAVMRRIGWVAGVQRPSPGAKPARVFEAPDGFIPAGRMPEIGPQEEGDPLFDT